MLLVFLTLLLTGLVQALGQAFPTELLIYRDKTSGACSATSERRHSLFRKLTDNHNVVVDTLIDNSSAQDAIYAAERIIAQDGEVAWSTARSLCGDDAILNRAFAVEPAENAANVPTDQRALDISDSNSDPPSPPLEIQSLSVSGPSHNRVDLVFFSDGYLAEEYDKFIADATRLALDISQNQTFYTVKPLLNFWAAFSPSKDSGIGTGGVPRDTPFGLYRDGTELRGVYYSKPDAATAACSSMGSQCDYPILLGNDPLYGGLGGQFTVITSSIANGPLVLRHELGHSIIDVGEEYDGGFAYFGPNAAHNLSEPLPWAHWLSNASGALHAERSVMPVQVYAWTLLNRTTPWSTNFTSSGAYSRHLIRFSLSGLPDETDLKVELDGFDLGWVPQPGIGLDRWHYDIYKDAALNEGAHEVRFTLVNEHREGTAQLCSVEILEFGNATEFIADAGHYGIFPTYSETNETSYRPTNEDCLMRVVTSPNFCRVCVEGLWLALLNRVEFIDGVTEECHQDASGHWTKSLDVQVIPLAQFRVDPVAAEESYKIVWTKDGRVLDEFANQTRLEVDDEAALGTYGIYITFGTAEVKVDQDGLLSSGGEYTVEKRCAQYIE